MNEGIFDHSPAVLTVHNKGVTSRKPFKYYKMRENHPSYSDLVKKTWQEGQFEGTKMYCVISKMKALKRAFKELNTQSFGDIQAQEAQAKNILEECQNKLHQHPLDVELQLSELAARNDYVSKHKSLLSFLHQKAKLTWAKDGDENSALFHTNIRERRRHNQVLSITNVDGQRVEEPNDVKEAFISYHVSLLGTCMHNRLNVKKSILKEGNALTRDQVELLMENFTREYVKRWCWKSQGLKPLV
uniref:Uncharacterized protein n=1 Tax=Cannabis sativa TaxID=3483 RepID=A0A803QPT2_CANSA